MKTSQGFLADQASMWSGSCSQTKNVCQLAARWIDTQDNFPFVRKSAQTCKFAYSKNVTDEQINLRSKTTTTTILFFGLNASTLVNTDTVRPGGGGKTLPPSRLPPPNHLLSNTLNQWCSNFLAHGPHLSCRNSPRATII